VGVKASGLALLFIWWFLLCFPALALSAPPTEWQLESSRNGVQVFSAEGDDDLTWVKAQILVSVPHWSLLNLLRDTANAETWIDNVISVELLLRPDIFSDVVRTRFHSPWPFSDREMQTFSSIIFHYPKQKLTIDVWQSYREEVTKGYVQMQHIKGQWVSEQINSEQSRITWTGTGVAGGSIPDWLASDVMLDSTAVTFTALGEHIGRKKYSDKPLAYLIAQDRSLQ